MATSFKFGNQLIKLPGSYSRFTSGVQNPALSLPYGNVLLIDTGSGAGFGSGAGISGDIASGADAIYEAESLSEFRDAIGGGILWDIAEGLFLPNGPGGGNGISKLIYARSAATVAAEVTIDFTADVNGGTAVVKAKNEGTVGNGVETSSVLTRGYAVTMSAGTDDPEKFVIEFWRGTYRGADSSGFTYDGVAEANTKPVLVARSPEFTNIADLHVWMETDAKFGSEFVLDSKTVVGTGVVVTADLTANAGNTLFASGTTTYATEHLDTILEHIQGLDYSLVLCDKYGDEAQHTDNGKILSHLTELDTFGDKCMFVGGGSDSSKFAEGTALSSIETAKYYDNDRVWVCHGDPFKNSTKVASGKIYQTTLHKAARLCGLTAGLPPQIPITFKPIKIDGEKHKLSPKEQRQGLAKGVVMTIEDGGRFTVLQGVTSIQNNDYLINSDATTHSIQLRRMMAQVNTEIEVNATRQLLKKPDGTNRNTLKASDVKSWVEGYLQDRTATTTQDNMIISFRNVVVTLDNDTFKCTYEVIFNTEITKLFFTGKVFLSF